MYKVEVTYLEECFQIQCEPSGGKFCIEIEKREHSECCNPIETLLTSLSTCIGIYSKRYLERHRVPFSSLKVEVSGEMSSDSPKRIVNINVRIKTDAKLEDKTVFLRFVNACPVHNTLVHTKEGDVNIEVVNT